MATPVQSVTTAAAPRSEDRDARARRYLIQMGIRTACFIGAVLTTGWLQIVLIVGAVVLPYLAVVGANNTGPDVGGTLQAVPVDGPALTGGAAPHTTEQTVVISGDVVDNAPRALPAGSDEECA
ncbi:MAG: DUF3099 domain-containing protein [Micrococcus sp.]|nr:DUF3099 domain-containing protein [Micrococcus sp.]